MKEMLDDLFKGDTYKAMAAELIGTFFLTLVGLLAGTPYAVALNLAALVYAIGNISGCNINPAITIGLMAARRLPPLKGALYLVAQVSGALLAATTSFRVGTPAPDYRAAGAFAEFFGLGLLIFVVVAVSDKYVPQAGSGIAVGAALGAGLVATGGILNPAVALAMSETLTPATWATILGGIVFAGLFALIAPKPAAKKGSAPKEAREDHEVEDQTRSRQRPSFSGSGAAD